MSQPGIAAYATRITRRQAALQKQQVLDRDNSNIISISGDTKCPVSPRKSDQKTPELHESSPAKIRKTADKLQVKEVNFVYFSFEEKYSILQCLRKKDIKFYADWWILLFSSFWSEL